MNSPKKYSWTIYFITAALLLAMGIVMIVQPKVIIYLMGFLFLIFAVTRFVPLLKTTSGRLMRWILAIELLIEIAAGVALLLIGMKKETIGKEFGYIVGSVFYLRGFVHFLATSLKGEPNSLISFIFHMVLLTSGVLIFIDGDINSKVMSIALAVLLFVCVVFQIYKGGKSYKNYRMILLSKAITKKIRKEDKKNKKAPTSDEIVINIPDKDNVENEINA